ncbi:RNA polymerase recycling motor ATPase HelR [Psychromicrobium lacuslunae]|uniref:ATPase AAA n=1 Tax=Psychromicrobium lacuslunae TaxID=1618207 RepID=A0A0D4C2P4_9MICC|nr:RNA polymerase recycling motor ATPase HelR [Psychromicrobium lacuslunae]AJT42655.1 ATPase AAA [Psychromicrobium lacuslunae]
MNLSAFNLPANLVAKADPELIQPDEVHFAMIERSLESSIAELTEQLEAERKAPGGQGQAALERDQEIHRLSARLRALRRFGLDLCLGYMITASEDADPMIDQAEPVYIGRFGLTDGSGRRLLLDWRAPAAEPFFGATHANPMGLLSRRRYRWTRGRVTDYWDEVFTPEGLKNRAALDDQSAFIASLADNRSARMRDVLGTIQADQDAIIRAGSRGALVVDGGPGTGKTVVALHRTAYLLYSDPRLEHHRGDVLFVGPHQPYLNYVADVLPSLGEEGVQTCTLRDFVPEGATAITELDPQVVALKTSAELLKAIDSAVALYERPPTEGMLLETPWADVWLSAADWAEGFDAAEPAAAHNEARDQIWDAVIRILLDKLRDAFDDWQDDVDEFDACAIASEDQESRMRRALAGNRELVRSFGKAWPLLEAAEIVGDLWSVPAYLRMSAPWLSSEQLSALRRPEGSPWTDADLPFLDAARLRLGDPEASRRRQRQAAAAEAGRNRMSEVVRDAIANDDSEMQVMSMLRGQDLRAALVDQDAVSGPDPDLLAGPFGHIVVDEAQELNDAQWQMLLQRCPSRSFTIVGDRAQARHGFAESWRQRLARLGFDRIEMASLTINYRTPEEVMIEAEPVIRSVLPDANVPHSIRSSGIPVRYGMSSELSGIMTDWLATHQEGVGCVISAQAPTGLQASERLRLLSPELVKGLEFDLVVLLEPENFGEGIEAAVDRYVAMTRATQQLVVLSAE